MRILVVSNVLAGSGSGVLYDLVHVLGRRDCELVLRYYNGQGSLGELVHDAADFDRVVAGGGDGTVSALAYAMRGSGTPLVACPIGTANLIAANIGMPSDAAKIADTAIAGECLPFDLGELTHLGSLTPLSAHDRRGFIVAAGAGFDAAIMDGAQPLKSTMGVLAYIAAIMQNLTPTRASFKVTIDGQEETMDGIAVLVFNFGRITFDLSISHDSNPRDGVFEVALIRSRTAVGLIPAVWDALLDRVVERPARGPIEVRRAREVLVEADPPLRLQYDGDTIEPTTPFGARVLPGAVNLMVPTASRHTRPESRRG